MPFLDEKKSKIFLGRGLTPSAKLVSFYVPNVKLTSDLRVRPPPRKYWQHLQGRFKEGTRVGAPSKILAPSYGPPMKFMIKHNLPLVRGGSLWQYRSVPPSCNSGHPTAPSKKSKPQNRHCTPVQRNYHY